MDDNVNKTWYTHHNQTVRGMKTYNSISSLQNPLLGYYAEEIWVEDIRDNQIVSAARLRLARLIRRAVRPPCNAWQGEALIVGAPMAGTGSATSTKMIAVEVVFEAGGVLGGAGGALCREVSEHWFADEWNVVYIWVGC
jgi:hypothetical protein